MSNVLIYGCGYWGKKILSPLQTRYGYTVLAYIDRNEELYREHFWGIPVESPQRISEYDFDYIIIAIDDYRQVRFVREFLEQLGIDANKIKSASYSPELIELFSDQRTEFIKDIAMWINENNIEGSVAECGVFRGDSAKFINRYFEDRKLYLFDTFEGFNNEDLAFDIDNKDKWEFNDSFFDKDLFTDTSLEIIREKMTSVQNVIIKQGYFPQTANDVEDRFCFVNLDMDLYMPTLSGLEFFWDRMNEGGVILLHDYFHKGLQGVKQAVNDFENKRNITFNKVPIGDHISLAIIK